jgi:Fe-S-cluster containining protein
MSSVCEICSTKCFGIDGYDGSCCKLEGRNFIIGPILDSDEFLERINGKLERRFEKSDIFVEFEEGKNLFPDRSVWQDPGNFPALRVDVGKSQLPCIFYNTHGKFCSVHDIRPKSCQDYFLPSLFRLEPNFFYLL